MDSFQSLNHKSKPKHKKSLTQDQISLLEISFNQDNNLRPERKAQLARDLGVPPRQIAIWYQNKKARWKSQTLELDYRALQLNFDSVFDEKTMLEREAWMLRSELQKAHEMLFAMNMNLNAPPFSSVSNSWVGSNLPSEVNCNWEKEEVMQIEEQLYACLMSSDDKTAKLSKY